MDWGPTCLARRHFVARALQCAAMFPRAKKGIYERPRSQPVRVCLKEVPGRGSQGNQECGDIRVGQIDMARHNRGILEGRDSYTVEPSCRVAEIKETHLGNVAIRERSGRGGASLNQGCFRTDNLTVRDGCNLGLHGSKVRYQRGDG